MVRVLVTVEPRMYREAITLAVQHNRPDSEVMLVPEELLDGQVKDFAPHVLVHNDSDQEVPEEANHHTWQGCVLLGPMHPSAWSSTLDGMRRPILCAVPCAVRVCK